MAKKSAADDQVAKEIEKRKKLLAELDNKHYPVRTGWSGGVKWCVPSGLASFDIISARDPDGIYGIPGGCMFTLMGKPKVGKGSTGLTVMGNAQRPDPLNRRPPMLAYFIETEGGLVTREWMETQGVDVENMLYDIPDSLEEAFEGIRAKLTVIAAKPPEKRVPMFILLDSISNVSTEEEESQPLKREKDGSTAKGSKMGHARVNSEKIRQLTPLIRKTQSIICVIAQSKAEISFGYHKSNFEKETFLGARPVQFYSSLVYNMSRGASLKDAYDNHVGMITYARVEMSKVGIPYGKTGELEFHYATGFDRKLSLHDALLTKGLIKQGKERTPQANVYTFQLRLKGDQTISYHQREGIHTLDETLLAVLRHSLTLSDEKRAKLALPEEVSA